MRVRVDKPSCYYLAIILLILVLILPQKQLIPQLAHRLLMLDTHPHDVIPQLRNLSTKRAVGHADLLFLHFDLVVFEERFVEGLDESAEDVSLYRDGVESWVEEDLALWVI
jgi:hypothetical protein